MSMFNSSIPALGDIDGLQVNSWYEVLYVSRGLESREHAF
jgi:hypothetical protein